MEGENSGFKTRAELAAKYNVSPQTFNKKIKPLRMLFNVEKRKKVYSPAEQKIIYEYLG